MSIMVMSCFYFFVTSTIDYGLNKHIGILHIGILHVGILSIALLCIVIIASMIIIPLVIFLVIFSMSIVVGILFHL